MREKFPQAAGLFSKGELPSGGIYEIIDKIYAEDDDLSKDRERRKLIKSRKHKLQKRLVEPYKRELDSAE